MSQVKPATLAAERYVGWLYRRGGAVIAASVLLLAASIALVVFRLPLYADFSHLLPQDAPSVRDLRRLEARLQAQDTVLVVVRSAHPEARAKAASTIAEAARRLPPTMVSRVETDDAETRAFYKRNRFLFVPLEDLEAARDALTERIRTAKLGANPLFIDLDEEESAEASKAAEDRLKSLREKRREAEARFERSGFISQDGAIQLVVIRTAFLKTEAGKAETLLDALEQVRAKALADGGGAVEIGFTGGVVAALAEHVALARGILLSSLVTIVLVALVLVLYFRSFSMLVMLTISLLVGVAISFGSAALTVGHLNAATAFLGAIIAGNGVNYGILLIARFLEERRRHDARTSMAIAIRGTLRPTVVASLGAAIAYGSLSATSFRGFADFAVIGAIGMLICWISAFVLLPVLVIRFAANPRVPSGDPIVGKLLASLLAFRHPALVCAVAGLLTAGACWISYRYIAADPFEYDLKELRSEGRDARDARRWLKISDDTFGRGISGITYVAADRMEQVPLIVDALRAVDKGVPEEKRTLGVIHWIRDLVPDQQGEKRKVLGEIRRLTEDPALQQLPAEDRQEIESLTPPPEIPEIKTESIPSELADKLRERDGQIGLLVGVRPANKMDEWDGRNLIRFAAAIRSIRLANGETVTSSGPSVIFADIVEAIESDGPRVTGLAAIGLLVMVIFVVGWNLRAVAVLLATTLGSVALVAVCALLELRVNFLDFVALPITLGLGVDYAVNIGHRHGDDSNGNAVATLRTSGSAVFVCSLTTIIGYGSLLVSDNLAIRSFGKASLIGEVCCLITALVVVPAVLSLASRRQADAVAP